MGKIKWVFANFILDSLGFTGFLMLFYGLFQYSEPLAWCVNGSILLMFAVVGAVLKPAKPVKRK